ncbi:MAG: hypothetical protein CMM02_11185 [Rhodopirellula sp.]|jgi:hypothetical protein|nr:hypothetical protein [Rhodopirellula sp.]
MAKLVIDKDNTPSNDDGGMAKAWELKQSMIPKDDTFNVVSIDEHEMPSEALYFVGNYDTKAEAHSKQKEQERKGIRTFIYDKTTK